MVKWEDRDSSVAFEDREDIIFEDTESSLSQSSSSSSGSSVSSSRSSERDLFADADDIFKSTLYDLWEKEGVVTLPVPTGLRIIP